ncbi:MAG TPA: peptidylprolyl isomerase [Rudaea sp.]|jgi:peptidyl-prolyl cis-trans isomerase SurA|nr:peptidylprolyl isomerase [Rudaea sp.]
MNRIVFCLSFLVSALGAWSGAQAQALQPAQPLDRIVAVADDSVILQSELDAAVANVLNQYRANPQQLPPRDVLERQVLESLIMLRLQVARAKDTGIRVNDSEIDQAVQRVAESNKMTVDQLRASLASQNMSYADFRDHLRDQLLVQRLQQRVVQGQSNVSDSEIDILLASNSLKSGQVHLQHILIGLPNGADASQIAAARAKADEVKAKIDGGMDFTTAAIQYSSAQDALQGGDLGWRGYDEVPEAFANLVEGMKPGEVSQPLRGPSGFHIVKLVDKRTDGKQVVTEYHARHILIKVNELTSSDQAKKTIEDIRNRIVNGHEDFATLAKKDSQDPSTASAGGDMGWFPIDQYGSSVATALTSLKDGEVSQPFLSDLGWHILQLEGTRQKDRSKEMKREQAREVIRNRKAEQAYEDFLRQVRSEAYVEIRLPGAESKPDPDKSAP